MHEMSLALEIQSICERELSELAKKRITARESAHRAGS
jgi:hypothetical protein